MSDLLNLILWLLAAVGAFVIVMLVYDACFPLNRWPRPPARPSAPPRPTPVTVQPPPVPDEFELTVRRLEELERDATRRLRNLQNGRRP